MTNSVALLVARPATPIADDEYATYMRTGKLDGLDRIDLGVEQQIDLDSYSAVIISGSPYNYSALRKTAAQIATEANLARVIPELLERDFPTLAVCYGLQALGWSQGHILTEEFGEQISAPYIALTEAGKADPLFAPLGDQFRIYTGHSESMPTVPPSATLLATSATCPVQAVRFGENVYGVQFHPEIDHASRAVQHLLVGLLPVWRSLVASSSLRLTALAVPRPHGVLRIGMLSVNG